MTVFIVAFIPVKMEHIIMHPSIYQMLRNSVIIFNDKAAQYVNLITIKCTLHY